MRKQRILRFALAALAMAAPAFAQSGSLSTQDYIEIQQLYARYNHAIDSGDAEAYAGTFTADGVFNNNNGREALLTFARGYAKNNGSNRRHWNTNLLITPTPEGANGTVYLFLLDVTAKPPSIVTTLTYEDTMVKTPQGWRFKKRMTKPDVAPASASAATPRPPQ
jgi:actinorhodin biosynthesis protein ActVIA